MLPEAPERVEFARAAPAEKLVALLHEADEQILLALIENPNFQETHAELLLERADISSAVITSVAEKGMWMASEGVRLRIAQHAHSPTRLALAAVRQLFLFDLVRVCMMPSAPPDIRRTAEEAIIARVPYLAVGEKLTLARRGPARVAGAILAEGHPQAMKLALGNGFLTESQVLKVLAKGGVAERVVAAIAAHPKWSCVYNVRAALVRNEQTPVAYVQRFVDDLTLRDLIDISEMRELSGEARKLIVGELARRHGNAAAGPKSADIE
jgi:hypothetical protein